MGNALQRLAGGQLEATLHNMEQLKQLVQAIDDNKKLAAWTKKDYKMFLKMLWKFANGFAQDDTPTEIKWLKAQIKERDRKLPKGLLTEDEIAAMMKAAATQRDKAIIMLLYECGLRISELCALKKSDLEFVPEGVRVHIPEGTKTGARSILGVDCAPYLAAYLANHPVQGETGALFVGQRWTSVGRKKKAGFGSQSEIEELQRC
jgi:integrase